MVTKRIRSEYMKKFKDPKWETYSKCYEELLKYRLTRRLLEQSHNPWFWGDWTSDTSNSGKSSPQGNKVEPLHLEDEKLPEQMTPPEHLGKPMDEEIQIPCESVNREPDVEEEDRRASPVVSTEVKPEAPVEEKSRQHISHKPTQTKRIQRGSNRQNLHEAKDGKMNRHPFAMYGSGDREADMASKKTHNVSPSASTKEIHESALRAKTRRDVEKQVKKAHRSRARSVDLARMTKAKTVADFDPWMTEYMHCFSARSQ